MSGQQVGPMAQYSQRERRELLAKIGELQAQLDRAKGLAIESEDLRRFQQAEWKRRYEALEEATDGEAWAWVGDGSDDLGSMSEGMVVAIGAGQLRELTRATEPRPMSEAPRSGWALVEFSNGERKRVNLKPYSNRGLMTGWLPTTTAAGGSGDES